MRRMPVVGPFLPPNIHFLDVETALCQLQSYLCGKLSILAPTVSDKLLAVGNDEANLSISSAGTHHPPEYAARKRLPPPRVQQHKIKRASLHRLQHIVPLFLCMSFMKKIITIRVNFLQGKSHGNLLRSRISHFVVISRIFIRERFTTAG